MLNDAGEVGVCAVEGEVVIFHPIKVLGDDAAGVWVIGRPDAIDIIAVGHVFVRAGQKVRVVRITAAPGA